MIKTEIGYTISRFWNIILEASGFRRRSSGMTSAARTDASPVIEGHYTACVLAPGDARLEACWQLRHRVFVEQRGWVPDDPERPGLEVDAYDAHARHLAVFDGECLTAYLRALPWVPGVGFMLEREFSCLLASSARAGLPRTSAVELSRLACRVARPPATFIRSGEPHPLEVLLKLLYRLALAEGIEHFHIVVEAAWLRPFARRFGLPFSPLGETQVLGGGTRTVAATATLPDLESAVLRRWPDKHAWYQADSGASPIQDAGSGSSIPTANRIGETRRRVG
jgi:N-acyl-L-homoserine lactone synthetase